MFFDQNIFHFPVLSSLPLNKSHLFSQVHHQLSRFVHMYLYDLQHLTGAAYMSMDRRLFSKQGHCTVGISMTVTPSLLAIITACRSSGTESLYEPLLHS